jgi:hypothetical protein
LDHTGPRLDFTYEGLDRVTCPEPTPPDAPAGGRRSGKSRIVVDILDIDRTGPSFLVDVFVAGPAEGAEEARRETSAFAGSFGIFGAGMHHHGHGGGRLKSQQHVDITETVDRLGLRDKKLRVQLLATTPSGDEMPVAKLPVGQVVVRAM